MASKIVRIKASPSIALVKYWGKSNVEYNLPATSSLAITVTGLFTEAQIEECDSEDKLTIDGLEVPPQRHRPFFDSVRSNLGVNICYRAQAQNNFPSSAGLASSSSVYAALAEGCSVLTGKQPDRKQISRLARMGSASAARSVWGGFSVLRAGSEHADPMLSENYWPDLRLLVAITSRSRKPVYSRDAMLHVAETSPYYKSWVVVAEENFRRAIQCVRERNLQLLGGQMRASYMRMFGTMFAADPPINYLKPQSLKVIETIENLRLSGINAWETMDAGPQVKIACLVKDVGQIRAALEKKANLGPHNLIETKPGPGPIILG